MSTSRDAPSKHKEHYLHQMNSLINIKPQVMTMNICMQCSKLPAFETDTKAEQLRNKVDIKVKRKDL
jgi:hypothetical protein